MADRPSLPALIIAIAVLAGSYCRVASSASPAVEDELRGGGGAGGPTTMRRRAASVMVPITILKSAVSDGAGTHICCCIFCSLSSWELREIEVWMFKSSRCHLNWLL
jgi:hypothetical protein